MFAARSLTFAAHSLTLSATLTSQANAKNISNYPLACPLLNYAGADCAAKLFCAAYFLGAAPSECPVGQHTAHTGHAANVSQAAGTFHSSVSRRVANFLHLEAAETRWLTSGRETAHAHTVIR